MVVVIKTQTTSSSSPLSNTIVTIGDLSLKVIVLDRSGGSLKYTKGAKST